MRNEEEIREVLEKLDRDKGSLNQASDDFKSDDFKYGYLMGKMTALEWVLGDAPSSDIGIHFDFEDWERELREAGEEVRGRLKDENRPPS
jgi:hypothetical protein